MAYGSCRPSLDWSVVDTTEHAYIGLTHKLNSASLIYYRSWFHAARQVIWLQSRINVLHACGYVNSRTGLVLKARLGKATMEHASQHAKRGSMAESEEPTAAHYWPKRGTGSMFANDQSLYY